MDYATCLRVLLCVMLLRYGARLRRFRHAAAPYHVAIDVTFRHYAMPYATMPLYFRRHAATPRRHYAAAAAYSDATRHADDAAFDDTLMLRAGLLRHAVC